MEVIENKGANLQGHRGTGWYLRFVRGKGVAGHGRGPVEICYLFTEILVRVTWLPQNPPIALRPTHRCQYPGCNVISQKKLLEASEQHADLGAPLDVWYRIAKKAAWKNLVEVRRQLPAADAVEEFKVFNIKGNAYRLITEINYRTGRIFLRHVLTHADYSKGAWKK